MRNLASIFLATGLGARRWLRVRTVGPPRAQVGATGSAGDHRAQARARRAARGPPAARARPAARGPPAARARRAAQGPRAAAGTTGAAARSGRGRGHGGRRRRRRERRAARGPRAPQARGGVAGARRAMAAAAAAPRARAAPRVPAGPRAARWWAWRSHERQRWRRRKRDDARRSLPGHGVAGDRTLCARRHVRAPDRERPGRAAAAHVQLERRSRGASTPRVRSNASATPTATASSRQAPRTSSGRPPEGTARTCTSMRRAAYAYSGTTGGVKRWAWSATSATGRRRGEDILTGQPSGGSHPKHTVHVWDGYMYAMESARATTSRTRTPTSRRTIPPARSSSTSSCRISSREPPLPGAGSGEVFAEGPAQHPWLQP